MSGSYPYDREGRTDAMRLKSADWFNASAIAKAHGKSAHKWLGGPNRLGYIIAVGEHHGLSYDRLVVNLHDGSLWLHPKLTVDFARWLDVKFAVYSDHPEPIEPDHFASVSERAHWQWEVRPRQIRERERIFEWFRQTFTHNELQQVMDFDA